MNKDFPSENPGAVVKDELVVRPFKTIDPR